MVVSKHAILNLQKQKTNFKHLQKFKKLHKITFYFENVSSELKEYYGYKRKHEYVLEYNRFK